MTDIPDLSGLTAKQRAFVGAILEGQGDTEAYRTAGYSQNISNMDQAIKARALKGKGHIKSILTAFQLRNAEKMDMTAEAHTRQLIDLAGKAEAAGQFNAAIRAVELTGKVTGHYVERVRQEEAPQVADAFQVMIEEIHSTLGPEAARQYAKQKGVEWLPARDTDDSTKEQDNSA